MARGGIRLVHGHTKSTLITYFSGMKIDPDNAFYMHFFNFSVMSFPKFVYMTKKHTLFSNFARFCTPKRCTCVQCLILKNNPNYVNFWTSLIPPLDIRGAPRGCRHLSDTPDSTVGWVTMDAIHTVSKHYSGSVRFFSTLVP